MSKTLIVVAVVGTGKSYLGYRPSKKSIKRIAFAALLAEWPLGIPSAIAAGFLAGYALADRDPTA